MDTLQPAQAGYHSADACAIEEFAQLVEQQTHPRDTPHSCEIAANIPVYDIAKLPGHLTETESRRGLMAEWAKVLQHGAGVIVLRHAYADTSAIDDATKIFQDVITREKESAGGGADHFAAAGSNDRIWNALQKLCEADPEVFVRYHGNLAIDAACEAWLGPNYQMTAQVNVVHPGGQAQQAHRDYHLGFQTADVSALYPAHVHDLSPLMTLQGGIAHCDVPIESGPTKLLPFSQLYRAGYAAWRRGDFRDYFEEHYVQLPLKKGDVLFFNPALFHAAGANTTSDVHRMVNLLQISSAFGRAMESIDREKMCKLSFPALKSFLNSVQLNEAEIAAAIASIAEGYSFPTNLDTDPPTDGLAPQTQNQLLSQATREDWTLQALRDALTAQTAKQHA